MHLEVTKVRLHSLKDFAKHYLMIVLSILTALGLEAWIEHSHRTHAANAASQRIEAEIRTNLSETRTSLHQDTEQLKRLSEIRKAVIDNLKSGVADDTIKQRILALTKDRFDLNLSFPTLRHEAWDVSVANQAASWMEDDRLQRYAAAYANQRDSITNMTENTTILMSGSRLVDTVADLQTNEVQPREFLHVVSQMIAIQQQTVNALGALEKQLMTALPNDGAADTKPSPAS